MTRILASLLLAAALIDAGTLSLVPGVNDFQTTAGEIDSNWKNKNIETINTVRTLIMDWADSWREKNIDRYLSYYSHAFRSGNLDYKGWQDRKTQVFKRPGAISLKVSDLWVTVEDNHASASFIQYYRDSQHSDTGEKIIYLIQNDGEWKILSEEWRPINR